MGGNNLIGINEFKKYSKGHEAEYVGIGGIEALTKDFGQKF